MSKLPEGWEWNFDEDAAHGPGAMVQRYWPSLQEEWRCYMYLDPNKSLRVVEDQFFANPLAAIQAVKAYQMKENGTEHIAEREG